MLWLSDLISRLSLRGAMDGWAALWTVRVVGLWITS